ncbi:MAG: MBOAT family protein [Bacteroidales bacterium]|nr:MBOAT family protein [Bacteroidales bacterium]MCI2145113.1 MBOAT family protein [Bacteroidales bacterium]
MPFSSITDILSYHQEAPMLFNSELFLILFALMLLFYVLLRKRNTARIIYVILFSLYFYYKSSGIYFLLLVLVSVTDFCIARWISRSRSKGARTALLVLSLSIDLGILGYFKYYNFFLSVFPGFKPADIFLPVGISFFTFQTISYVVDVYRGSIRPEGRWIDYLFYVSFFPQLVAGPIVRASDFLPQIRRQPEVSREDFGKAVTLIIFGLLKKAVISDYISVNFVDRVFAAPALYTGIENLLGVYGYTLQIYCDFSGYSDMAIGIALLMGFHFKNNFDFPYRSATVTEFWRRWHISLSTWLRDYLYIPLGGNRKGKARTYVNLMATMLLGGLWHGAALKFVAWGGLHGLALCLNRFLTRKWKWFKRFGSEMKPFQRFLGIFVTFHFVCFCWILFRAGSLETARQMLTQIFTDFHPEVFPQFVSGYRTVFILMVAGYMLHFLPRRTYDGIRGFITRSPLLLQALYTALAVLLAVQFAGAGVQPFIYFRF